MANFDFDFPEDMLSGLDSILDDVAPKMIEEALPTYQKALEDSVRTVISTASEDVKRQTGDLEKSLKILPPKRTKTGAYIGSVNFVGYNAKGSPNPVKALGLEYGNNHQVARPFMQKAANSCRAEVTDKMQQVFNREVKS